MSVGPRDLWMLIEPIHALTYFAPESATAYDEVGLRGFWRSYFAGRAAPLGAVNAPPVITLFYGFEPSFVERAIPSVWELCSPAKAIQARQVGAGRALQAAWTQVSLPEILAPSGSPPDTGVPDARAKVGSTEGLERATEILESACFEVSRDTRPLGLSNAKLDWPEDPYQRLWHATTVLREHRGDGHIAILACNDLGPCESTILRSACSGNSLDSITKVRGWDSEVWNEAGQNLIDRGLLQTGQTATMGTTLPSGRAVTPSKDGLGLYRSVEESTDSLAAAPFARLELDYVELESILAPVATELERSGVVPYPNPIGVPPRSA